jgi:beta-lactamase class D
MRLAFSVLCLSVLFISSCRDSRIFDHPDWGKRFEEHGIKTGCFIIRDNNHEAIHYYNKERCIERVSTASTFKVFLSLVALETAVAPDEQYLITPDTTIQFPGKPEWSKTMNMREALKTSSEPYYRELARRIGRANLQHYLDTTNYGNGNLGDSMEFAWVNDSLQISADEQVGFLKRMYFGELPMSERTQRIVKSMMLQEDSGDRKLYYKTGWKSFNDRHLLWVAGFEERIEHVKEHEKSMNKSDSRMYPYFFAMNFEVPKSDTSKNWAKTRIVLLKQLLADFKPKKTE